MVDNNKFHWRDLGRFLLAAGGIFVLVAICNTVVDPLHLFRHSEIYVVSAQDQRWINVGRIRTDPPFDAAVVGSSYVANFSPSKLRDLFDVRAEVFSVVGGSARETMLTLNYLLKTRPGLRMVFFEASIWGVCDESLHPAWSFPIDLYQDSRFAELKYAFAGRTMRLTMGQLLFRLRGRGSEYSRSQEAAHRWYEFYPSFFNNPEIVKAVLKRDLPNPPGSRLAQSELDAISQQTLHCMRRFLEVSSQHPETQFFLFNPPVLQYLLWFRGQLGLLDAWMNAQELFATTLPPNVRYFDFYAALEVENDCRRFMDVAHFDPHASDQIAQWIRTGEFERTAGTNAAISLAIKAGAKNPLPCPPTD